VPQLHQLDSITGELLRASKKTAVRYERERDLYGPRMIAQICLLGLREDWDVVAVAVVVRGG